MTDKIKKNRTNRQAAILVIAGEGGHLEQARRLSSHLAPDIKELASSILLTDHDRESDSAFDHVVSVSTCAPKHRNVKINDVVKYWIAMAVAVFRLLRKYKIKSVIVTGPGFALLPALLFRVTGAKLIVFESWSRFEDKSKCSKALYPFAHHFFVQHQHLLQMYPKAVWVGLL